MSNHTPRTARYELVANAKRTAVSIVLIPRNFGEGVFANLELEAVVVDGDAASIASQEAFRLNRRFRKRFAVISSTAALAFFSALAWFSINAAAGGPPQGLLTAGVFALLGGAIVGHVVTPDEHPTISGLQIDDQEHEIVVNNLTIEDRDRLMRTCSESRGVQLKTLTILADYYAALQSARQQQHEDDLSAQALNILGLDPTN